AQASFERATRLPFRSDGVIDLDRWEVMNNLGRIRQMKHKYGEAENAFKQALQLADAVLGPANPTLALVHDNLGSLYTEMQRFTEAENQFHQSLAIFEQAGSQFQAFAVAHTLYELARTYVAEHNEVRAQPLLERAAVMARQQRAGAELPEAPMIFDLYAKVLEDLSKSAEAGNMQAEARRARAARSFTVPVRSLN
ncbi:MAG TPA: tetratricopeptide repeat protein, partial [Terriglobia bacterium]|nr:tetratricopeptide repeat protein [Terriglobia bacterium]